jgi:hypothetical protein
MFVVPFQPRRWTRLVEFPPGRALPGPIRHNINTKLRMLYTLALVLIILWLLGFVSSYTMGGFIHILLVVAVVLILVRLIQGRNV